MEAVIAPPDYSDANIQKMIRIGLSDCNKALRVAGGQTRYPLVEPLAAVHEAIISLMASKQDLSFTSRKAVFCLWDEIRRMYGRIQRNVDKSKEYRRGLNCFTFTDTAGLLNLQGVTLNDSRASFKELMDEVKLFSDQRYVLEAIYLAGMTQKELAIRLDVAPSYICFLASDGLMEIGKTIQARDKSYSWIKLDRPSNAQRRARCNFKKHLKLKEIICNPTDVP